MYETFMLRGEELQRCPGQTETELLGHAGWNGVIVCLWIQMCSWTVLVNYSDGLSLSVESL